MLNNSEIFLFLLLLFFFLSLFPFFFFFFVFHVGNIFVAKQSLLWWFCTALPRDHKSVKKCGRRCEVYPPPPTSLFVFPKCNLNISHPVISIFKIQLLWLKDTPAQEHLSLYRAVFLLLYLSLSWICTLAFFSSSYFYKSYKKKRKTPKQTK